MILRIYKIRAVTGTIALVLVSMACSCQELRYMAWGKVVDAKVMDNHFEKEKDAPDDTAKHVLGYFFMDGDNPRREYATVPLNWNPSGQTVKVQYLAGHEMQSRIYGQRNTFWVALFFISLVAAAIGVAVLVRDTSG